MTLATSSMAMSPDVRIYDRALSDDQIEVLAEQAKKAAQVILIFSPEAVSHRKFQPLNDFPKGRVA